jgi:hypothetical protein
VSKPEGESPSGPGRPEMIRQKSAASITISSPSLPEFQLPPEGPVSSSRYDRPCRRGPLCRDVCDDDAVVVGGEHGGLTDCPREVQAVHPWIPSEDHVDQETDGPRPGTPLITCGSQAGVGRLLGGRAST